MRIIIVTILVLGHLAVLAVHGSAHSHLNIGARTWQKAFITIVIFVVPLVATMMLWMRRQKLGVSLLGLSVASSLVFGVSYHFVISGQDNAIGQCHSHWATAFGVTAVLLAFIESATLVLCLWELSVIVGQTRTMQNA